MSSIVQTFIATAILGVVLPFWVFVMCKMAAAGVAAGWFSMVSKYNHKE